MTTERLSFKSAGAVRKSETTTDSESSQAVMGDQRAEVAGLQNPFVVGARVSITDSYDRVHESFVDKVHKTGRFTLRGNPQQWRPSEPTHWQPYWSARKTNRDSWDRSWLRIWDETTDAQITEAVAKQQRRNRWRDLQGRLQRLREGQLTDAMLDAIETALPAKATGE